MSRLTKYVHALGGYAYKHPTIADPCYLLRPGFVKTLLALLRIDGCTTELAISPPLVGGTNVLSYVLHLPDRSTLAFHVWEAA
jgi:hypothetical protein